MKVLFSLIMILILSAHAISGQAESAFHYFNRVYVADSMNMFSLASSVVEDGYLITGTFNSSNTNGRQVYLRKIDLSGEQEWFKIVDNDNVEVMVTGRCMIKEGDYVYLTYTTKPEGDELNLDIVLLKSDLEGNVVWRKSYGEDNLREGARQVIQTMDNGFFITGHQQSLGSPSSYYCVKTDSLGNEEWSDTYQLDGHSIAFYGYQTWDGGYILSGYGYDEVSDYDMYLVKIDEEGNVEWERNYGSDEVDGGGKIKVLENSYLLLGSTLGYVEHYFYYLDEEGDIINGYPYYWDNLETLSFANIIPIEPNYLTSTTFYNENDLATPLFVLFNEYGDTLWTKPYSLNWQQKLLLRDVDPTPDGGYLLTGLHDTPAPQYSWVAKVDSLFNGCVGMSCDSSVINTDTTVSVSSVLPNISFNISPNPIQNQAKITYRLPMDIPYAILRLYDLKGNERMKKRLHTYQQEAMLEVTNLAAGLYTYVVELDRWRVAQGKLVVE